MMNHLKADTELIIPISENFIVEEVSKFRDETQELIKKGNLHFILDFSHCNFIDSTGLGVIVSLYKRCKELNGTLKLRHVNPQVMKLFELTRLNQVLEIQK